MTAKHTPGPWYDMPDGSMIPLKSIYCERLGFTIGFVNTDRKSVEEQAQANARLIAAAPDLLEALKAVEDQGYDMPMWLSKTVRAAIAKATGENA